MIIEDDLNLKAVNNMHHGIGDATFHDFFRAKKCPPAFSHNTALSPEAEIGFHRHENSEARYHVIWARGEMRVDDEEVKVGPWDAAPLRKSSSHLLRDLGKTEMRTAAVGGRA